MQLSSTVKLLFASAALLASTPSADAAERKLRGRHRNTKGSVTNDSNVGGASSDHFPLANGQETQQRRKLARCSGVCALPAECPADLRTRSLPQCTNAAIGELCLGDGECVRDDLDNCSYRILGGSAQVDRSVYVRSDCRCIDGGGNGKCFQAVTRTECPAAPELATLLSCTNDVAIGQKCRGDGACGTATNLDNCSHGILGGSARRFFDVYERIPCPASTSAPLYDSAFDIPRPTPPPTPQPTPPPTPPPKQPPKQPPCGHAGYPPCSEVGGAHKQQPPTEPAWEPGTLCGAGTTCENNCKDGYYEFWDSLFFTACGHEPCWEDGAYCAAGTTCNNCCNSYHWSLEHFFTVCGV